MASGSRGRGQGSAAAGGGDLDTLTNPDLALLSAVDLVVHLHDSDRDGSDFADAALVLAVRECRLAEAEDRVRKAGEDTASLRNTIRELELRAAKAEALACNSLGSDSGGFSGGERAVAREDDPQSLAGLEPQIGAAELTGGEIRPRHLTASETIVVPELPAGEIEDGEITPPEIKATPAEVGDNMPRPSPLRRIGATLPAASSMPVELPEERAVERVVVDVAVCSSHEVAQAAGVVDSRDEVSEAVAGKRKKEAAAAFVSQEEKEEPLKKKPKPAGALGVASEDSDSDSQVEAEAQTWKMYILEAQTAAWESEYDAADAPQGTLQAAAAAAEEAAPPVEEVQTAIEAEAQERSEATVARLQEQIILCERRLEEVKDTAKKTEERLCAEITKLKDKATTEAVLWEEILLAHTSAVTELEVWKRSATEAQAEISAASMTVAQLRDEIEGRKKIASETVSCLDIQDKIIAILQANVKEGKSKLEKAESRIRVSEQLVAALQNKVGEGKGKLAEAESRIRVSEELVAALQDKIKASEQDRAIEVEIRQATTTKIKEDLQAKIHTLELTVANLKARGCDINRSDRAVAIDEPNHSGMVPEIEVHRVVPAGATLKAPRPKGVSFYKEIFKSEMEKRKLVIGNEENEESIKKQAAKAASEALYLRCFSQIPYLPAQLRSQTAEEDSGDQEA